MFGNRFILMFVLAGLGWLGLSHARHPANPVRANSEYDISPDFRGAGQHQAYGDRERHYEDHSQRQFGGHSDRQHSGQPTNEEGRAIFCDDIFYDCLSRDRHSLGHVCVEHYLDIHTFPYRCLPKINDFVDIIKMCQEKVNTKTFEIVSTTSKC